MSISVRNCTTLVSSFLLYASASFIVIGMFFFLSLRRILDILLRNALRLAEFNIQMESFFVNTFTCIQYVFYSNLDTIDTTFIVVDSFSVFSRKVWILRFVGGSNPRIILVLPYFLSHYSFKISGLYISWILVTASFSYISTFSFPTIPDSMRCKYCKYPRAHLFEFDR